VSLFAGSLSVTTLLGYIVLVMKCIFIILCSTYVQVDDNGSVITYCCCRPFISQCGGPVMPQSTSGQEVQWINKSIMVRPLMCLPWSNVDQDVKMISALVKVTFNM